MRKQSAPWFVFAGGGTGGHLYPGLSVLNVLHNGPITCDVSFFCTQKPMDRDILNAARVEAVPLSVRPMPTRPWKVPGFLWRWHESVQLCLRRFKLRRPAAVVGAGGYASGPPVQAARQLGIPAFLLNPDAVPGRANRHMARRGGLSGVFAQWEVTREHFPDSVEVFVTGCPVREGFRESRKASPAQARQIFGLEPERPTLLVTGASQGARTINEAMMQLAGELSENSWQLLHLSGPADAPRVEQACKDAVKRSSRGFSYAVLPFTDRMPMAMAAADLVVSRAGASTLSELQAAGKPSILLPYPYHRDQHQRHNAMVLVEAGAAHLLDDAKDAGRNARQLWPVLQTLMGSDDARRKMTNAAERLDRPDATHQIADRLLQTVQKGGSRDAETSHSSPVKSISSPAARVAVIRSRISTTLPDTIL